MNSKRAHEQLLEAQKLLGDAQDLLRKENVTDADRAAAADLRERALKMKRDAELMHQIEQDAKVMIAEAEERAEQTDREAKRAAPSEFKTFGEFVVAVQKAKAGGRIDPRLMLHDDPEDDVARQQRKALSGEEGATGGFLIPGEYRSDFQTVMVSRSVALNRVQRLPMTSRTLTLPVMDYNQSLPVGVPRQFGGVQVFYDSEGADMEESEPKFRDHTLTAHEVTAYTETNNSMLADSAVSLEAFLQSDMGLIGALAWKIDWSIFRGTGVGQPLGILNSPVALPAARATDDTVSYADVVGMDDLALPSPNLVWYASISLKGQLRNLKDDAGNLIWASARDGLPATLLGYPIFFTDILPKLGTAGDLVLADMSKYLFGDRQAVTLDASTHVKFKRNRTAYRLIHRHDGGPWMNAALTLADTETEISPFVYLDA